jgi:hypothetical protein
MKLLLVVSVLALAGCASTSESPESRATRAASKPSRTADITPTASRRPRAVNAASQEQVTPELLAAWQAKYKDHPLGNFTIVMKDGREMFCRREAPTGSNLKRRGLCLTADEMEAAAAEAQRQLREFQKPGTVQQASPYDVPLPAY